MGEQIKSCFRFLLSCAGLLCGLALAGPIIEELGYFLTSAASVIVSIPFFGPVAFRFCPFTTTEVESIESICYSFISYPLLSGMSRGMHGDLSASQARIPKQIFSSVWPLLRNFRYESSRPDRSRSEKSR